jgi:LmbE family N-acetylglucosaminyl deacetylase
MYPKEPNYDVDITGTLKLKLDALARHASQMPSRAELEQKIAKTETFVRLDIS